MAILRLFPKDSLFAFWQERVIRQATRLSLLLLLFSLGFLTVFWPKLPPQLPLFYSLPWGEEQLVSPYLLLILPSGQFLVLVLNLALAFLSFSRGEVLASKILAWTAVLISFLTSLGLVKIVFLIT